MRAGMFALLHATVQMLDQGYCDIEGNRCTVGPKGFGTITIIDQNDTGSQEFPMEYTWNSCLDEHHTVTGDPDYCGEAVLFCLLFFGPFLILQFLTVFRQFFRH